MVLQILGDARFADPEMFRKARPHGVARSCASLATQQIADTYPQSLARFDVVVGGLVGIRQDENPGTCRRLIGFIHPVKGARDQSPQLCFKVCHPRGQCRFTSTATNLPRCRCCDRLRHGSWLDAGSRWRLDCSLDLRRGGRNLGRSSLCLRFLLATTPPATPPASPAPVAFRSTLCPGSLLCDRFRGRLGFGGRFRSFQRGFLGGNLFAMRGRSWRKLSRRSRLLRRNGSAQPCQSFLRLRLPLGAPEALGRDRVPAHRRVSRAGFFVQPRQLKRDHGVAGLFVQLGQLTRWIRAGPGLADTRLDLLPVSHPCDCISRRPPGLVLRQNNRFRRRRHSPSGRYCGTIGV